MTNPSSVLCCLALVLAPCLVACDDSSASTPSAAAPSAEPSAPAAAPKKAWHTIEELGVQIEFGDDGSYAKHGPSGYLLAGKFDKAGNNCGIELRHEKKPRELQNTIDLMKSGHGGVAELREVTKQAERDDGWQLEYTFANGRGEEMFGAKMTRKIGEKVFSCTATGSAGDRTCGATACDTMKGL